MKNKKHIRKWITIFLIVVIIVLTIVFLMSSTKIIRVSNKDNLSSASWNIHFENLNEKKVGNAVVIKHAQLSKKGTYIGDYEVILTKPGDALIYSFDVINDGTLNAILKNIVKSRLKCKSAANNKYDEELVCNNLKYTLKYKNGNDLNEYDLLDKKQRRNLVLTLKYEGDYLPTSKVKIHGLDIILLYNQR